MKLAMYMVLVSMIAAPARARGADHPSKARVLTTMLRQFLQDAAQGNRLGFEKFFADDVIYTRSAGVTIGKSDILSGIERLKPTADSKTTYSAEDVTVHDYRDAAVVAFRLVARTVHRDGKSETANYRNTGTFLRRNGRWRVVAWQSTKIPESGPNASN
ncbi:MAG: nuclear transport factor 2 family protein [Terriglobia bacterium]